jgi:acetylornithine/N-succinyldiaminopimelate aminotransferase
VDGHGLAEDLGRPIGGDVVTRAREAGLLINSPRPDALRFMPALNVTREEIGQMTAMLDRAFAQAT